MNKCKSITTCASNRPTGSTFNFMSVLQSIRNELHVLSTFDDPTLANTGLLCGGGILACTALVCCFCGMAFIFKGDFDSSRALLPYFSRSAVLAGLAFFAVRAKKGRRKG